MMRPHIRFYSQMLCALLVWCSTVVPLGAQTNHYVSVYADVELTENRGSWGVTARGAAKDQEAGTHNNNRDIRKAFDGNNGSWWRSGQGGSDTPGPVKITVDLKKKQKIDRITMQVSGAGQQERPAVIGIYYQSIGSTDWQLVQEFTDDRADDWVELLFDAPFEAQHVQFYLAPAEENHVLAINEIRFYTGNEQAIARHREPKWVSIKKSSGLSDAAVGTFDFKTPMFETGLEGNEAQIQAAHTYIDTIYVHKGTSIDLMLPTKQTHETDATSSTATYQRWYSFRTGKTFEVYNKEWTERRDLLTPLNAGTFCRFANGYVGNPLGSKLQAVRFYYPTDEEFAKMFPGDEFAQINRDNRYYIVACDASSYTDFGPEYKDAGSRNSKTNLRNCASSFRNNKDAGGNGFYEPTLGVRVIFYVVGVDENSNTGTMPLLKQKDYQGGGNKYLEEYDINFSNKRVSDNTPELVVLSKDARSYAVPTANAEEDNGPLSVSIESSNGQFRLLTQSQSLSGLERVIYFTAAPEGQPDSVIWTVPDGTTATIRVTKTVGGTTYNLARYNLTFSARSVPMTQTEVAAITDSSPYSYRSPEWLKRNRQLLTSLTFDYDPNAASVYGDKRYFPFPLEWGSCSYAFFDGPWLKDYLPENNDATYGPGADLRWRPEWHYYAIVNSYEGFGDQQTPTSLPPEGVGKPAGKYFLYIDASDRPGIVARLPFEENLCVGSELFVTAWMKSAGQQRLWNGGRADDASLLFTIMGVTRQISETGGKADTTYTYTPLYRHASGQIRRTTWLPKGQGTGKDTNEWYQLYFSFINNSDNVAQYDSYVLQVDNNCASTNGGDFYLDDIRIYLAQPSAEVTQKSVVCADERTRMNISLDWERITSRLGTEEDGDNSGIDFCFVDATAYQAAYDKAIAEHLDDNAAKQRALNESLAMIGDIEHYDESIGTLYFKNKFDSNTIFGTDGKEFAVQNHEGEGADTKYYFYRNDPDIEAGEVRVLTVDLLSDIVPNRTYWMLIIPASGATHAIEDFAVELGTPCCIMTEFYVNAQNLIKINGEVADPRADYCEGQVFNFTAQVRIPKPDDADDFIVLDHGVYFDWFFGTEQEFRAANEQYGGVSLKDALEIFRARYPDATELSEELTPWDRQDEEESEQVVKFTEDMYNIIKAYVDDHGDLIGLNNRLVLHREHIDITILSDGLKLVIAPIPIESKEGIEGVTEDQWTLVCWEPISVVLKANGKAPMLHAGFNEIKYPGDEGDETFYDPRLRIGLQQLLAAKDEQHTLKVRLRGAKPVTKDIMRLGRVEDLSRIYLIGTDDPQYDKYFTSSSTDEFDRFSLPIGHIVNLQAEPYDKEPSFDNHMTIYFDLDANPSNGFQFKPREGYTYTFSVPFCEKSDADQTIVNSCYGFFNIPMIIVPEYLVWRGTENNNWNDDKNWQRADKKDLHKAEADPYVTNADNETGKGFVPMRFSHVVLPTKSRAQLYMAGFVDDEWGIPEDAFEKPEAMDEIPDSIIYDLMVYGAPNANTLTTERFRVNLCHAIHLAPGAQLLHAEQLIYDKASVDISVPTKHWTLVSTPLRGVVAGDWYTSKATGSQENDEYFKDITFNSATHDRLSPAVFQRSWDTRATILDTRLTSSEAGSNVSNAGFDVSKPVWSSVYNDAFVPYAAGAGFSLKAGVAEQESASLMFRLPKADSEYDVSLQPLDRNGAGRLLISDLLDRNDQSIYNPKENVAAALKLSQDGQYMMVGNPFLAHLDLEKFFEYNSSADHNGILQPKYWMEGDEDSKAGGADAQGGQWIESLDGATVPPYGAFFVKKKENAEGYTVYFTADMQTLGPATTPPASSSLIITACNGNGRSTAALSYAASATNDYSEAEDVQLITDLAGNGSAAPAVYTIATSRAVSVNRVRDVTQIPLGVFAPDSATTMLTFSGVDMLDTPELYDARMRIATPLTEGYRFTVSGASHGRYFIRSRGAATTGLEGQCPGGASGVSIYSVVPQQVIVSAAEAITSVAVYSVGGQQLTRVTPEAGSTTTTINGVAGGVVIVRVTTAGGTTTRKISVHP